MFKSVFTSIYSLFVILPSFRWILISVMGMGFGIGIGLVVFQNPQASFASPAAYEIKKTSPDVLVTEFKIPNLKIDELDLEKNIIETNRSEGLGIDKLTVLEVKNKNLLKNLEKVLLGEKILAVGSNNGLYAFTAIETRIIPKNELTQAMSFYDEGLIIYGQRSWMSDELVLVVAR
ncbi:MAG: hypothetical protein ABFQ62_05335 [Patescibacteria group bacterium]